MTYIVERNTRFYVVAYEGLDPLTGRERRRWIPIGHDRTEAEGVDARLDSERIAGPAPRRGTVSVGEFLTRTWMPHKRRQVRATTAYRYAWFIERYINPAIGDIPLRRLRADHLDDLYEQLATTGGRKGTGLAPKTIAEVHMIVRAALDDAVARELVSRSVACHVRSRRRPTAQSTARSWTAQELHQFLGAASPQRLYPALHLAAHTGMRRGEVVGLQSPPSRPAPSSAPRSRSPPADSPSCSPMCSKLPPEEFQPQAQVRPSGYRPTASGSPAVLCLTSTFATATPTLLRIVNMQRT